MTTYPRSQALQHADLLGWIAEGNAVLTNLRTKATATLCCGDDDGQGRYACAWWLETENGDIIELLGSPPDHVARTGEWAIP